MGFAASATAQEVTYALPSTTLSIRVETRQESFFAGPYAAYAKKLLNIDVRMEDEVSTRIEAIRILPTVEADPSVRYTADADCADLMALSAQSLYGATWESGILLATLGHESHAILIIVVGIISYVHITLKRRK